MLKKLGITAVVLIGSVALPVLLMEILPFTVAMVCTAGTFVVCGISMGWAILLTWVLTSTILAAGILYYLLHKTTLFR